MSISHSGRAGRAARASSQSVPQPLAQALAGGSSSAIASSAALASATIPTRTGKFMPICVGFEIDLDQVGGHGHSPPVGHDLGEAAADGEHDIGVRQHASRARRARVAERERMAFVEQSLAVERGDHRRAEPAWPGFRSAAGCARPERTAAGQNDRSSSAPREAPRPAAIASIGTLGDAGRGNVERDGVSPGTGALIRSCGRKSAAGRGRPSSSPETRSRRAPGSPRPGERCRTIWSPAGRCPRDRSRGSCRIRDRASPH